MGIGAEFLFDRADITGSELNDAGETLIHLGDVTSGEVVGENASSWGLDGFLSSPNDVDSEGAAQALFIYDGNEKRVVGTRDRRWLSYSGSLKPGDRAIVSNSQARFMLKRADDSISLYTLNKPVDKSMMVNLKGDEGILTILNGSSAIMMKDDSITLAVNGGGSIILNKDGVTILGNKVQLAGGQIGLGVNPTQPVLTGLTGAEGKPSLTVAVQM